MKLSQLPVGALVKDPKTKYNNDVIIWQVLEHGHTGDPLGSTTLQSRDILTLKCVDAKEPNNSNNYRKYYGNNRYKYSNILQWLNSDKNNWYEAQHSADQEPSSSYVWSNNNVYYNPYDTEAGFLTNFSDQFKKALMTVSKPTLIPTIDGGGLEYVQSKVFLLSTTESNLANESGTAEGSSYSLYNTASYRVKNLFNTAAKGTYTQATSPYEWYLRTPQNSDTSDHAVSRIRLVNNDGSLFSFLCFCGGYGQSPALCISQNTEVSDTPDANNVYTLQFAPLNTRVYVGDSNNRAVEVWPGLVSLVHELTSDTQLINTLGECYYSKEQSSSGGSYNAYHVWNEKRIDRTPYWSNYGTNDTECRCGFKFNEPTTVRAMALYSNYASYSLGTYKYQYSNDGSTWIDITDILPASNTELVVTKFETPITAKYFVAKGVSKTTNVVISRMRIYG